MFDVILESAAQVEVTSEHSPPAFLLQCAPATLPTVLRTQCTLMCRQCYSSSQFYARITTWVLLLSFTLVLYHKI